ncbi:NAD-dependent epimerase/dehydratase family protein [Couchioplanes caeruleus]|uniref:NAD-dependent epimerase/dehydratase family protein n=1 Tax=Couchioplanes caeruleus TaxID=56438 RepID=UPI003D316FEF
MRERRGESPALRAATVTGTSGRVGAAIAAALQADGWFIRGVDRVPGRWTSLLGDLRDPKVRRAALQQSELLVHAAALHAPRPVRVTSTTRRNPPPSGWSPRVPPRRSACVSRAASRSRCPCRRPTSCIEP